jgi:hypothetical protein
VGKLLKNFNQIFTVTRDANMHVSDSSGNDKRIIFEDVIQEVYRLTESGDYAGSALQDLIDPVGKIYFQLPGENDPATLGLPGTWTDVSANYAGEFFRVVGGNALAFNGGLQGHAFQTHKHSGSFMIFTAGSIYNPSPRNEGGSGTPGGPTNNGNTIQTDLNETRPINESIKIWKRTV